MSAIGGAFSLLGAPLPSGDLQRMVASTRYRAPDGEGVWDGGHVGLVHSHHWTTPEEVGEQQPLVSEDGRYHLTADARLDNRDELIRELRAGGFAVSPETSDAGLILRSFQCWQEECLRRLRGDFAFAVWDERERRLFLARDVMGVRQLYHTVSNGRFYFATTLGALLAVLPARPPLNDVLIEEFLRNYFRLWTRETVYEGLFRLPPAHSLWVSEGKQVERLYYVLGSAPPQGLQSEADWIAGFRDTLADAVRCRTRSHRAIGILTGGGLDSSSLACLCQQFRVVEPGLPEIQLHAAYHQAPGADERRYFDEVAATCSGLPAFRLPLDDCWALRESGTDGDYPLDEPELYLLRGHTLALLRSAVKQGCGVVFAGEGANQGLGQAMYHVPSCLRELSLVEWPHELGYFRRHSRMNLPRFLFHAWVRPWLPEALLEDLRWVRPADTEWPKWVHRQLKIRRPSANLAREFVAPPGLAPSARAAHNSLRGAFDLARLAALDLTGGYAGVEWRMPFLDLRVVEFLLALPMQLRSWRGVNRRVLREAMEGILPEAVRVRPDKSNLSSLINAGLKEKECRRVEALLTHSRAEARGYLNVGVLRAAFAQYRAQDGADSTRIGRALALEQWLRTLEE